MENENVTVRKQFKQNSLNDISSNESSLFETTAVSLPNTSFNDSLTMAEIQEKNYKLRMDLSSANLEIENLNSENRHLQSELEKCQKIIEMYKRVGFYSNDNLNSGKQVSNTKYLTPLRKRKHKRVRTSSLSTPNQRKTLTDTPFIDQKQSPVKHETRKSQIDIDLTDETNKPNSSINNTCPPITAALDFVIAGSGSNIVNEREDLKKRHVIIIADQQGRYLQSHLQKLLGSNYSVSCFWKPGAKIKNVLDTETNLIKKLNRNDFVIVLGGTNDVNPYEFRLRINIWLETVSNTNVLISEVPFNHVLNEKKRNNELKFICGKYENVTYIDMNYSRQRLYRASISLFVSRTLLKDILQIEYKTNLINYRLKLLNKQSTTSDKYTQTEANHFNAREVKEYSRINMDANQNNNYTTTNNNFRT